MKTRLKQLYPYVLLGFFFALISACAAHERHILETEKDYQEALAVFISKAMPRWKCLSITAE